jgi:hypothetical protein
MSAWGAWGAWFLISFVWGVLLLLWVWLGRVFDVIDDYQAAWRERQREDAQADRERGS